MNPLHKKAAILLLFFYAAGCGAIKAGESSPTSSEKASILFIIDCALSMNSRLESTALIVADMVERGISGRLKDGDEIEICAYTDKIDTNSLAKYEWVSTNARDVSNLVFSKIKKIRALRRFNSPLNINYVLDLKTISNLTIYIVTDGNRNVLGIPIANIISNVFLFNKERWKKEKLICIIGMEFKNNNIVNWAIGEASPTTSIKTLEKMPELPTMASKPDNDEIKKLPSDIKENRSTESEGATIQKVVKKDDIRTQPANTITNSAGAVIKKEESETFIVKDGILSSSANSQEVKETNITQSEQKNQDYTNQNIKIQTTGNHVKLQAQEGIDIKTNVTTVPSEKLSVKKISNDKNEIQADGKDVVTQSNVSTFITMPSIQSIKTTSEKENPENNVRIKFEKMTVATSKPEGTSKEEQSVQHFEEDHIFKETTEPREKSTSIVAQPINKTVQKPEKVSEFMSSQDVPTRPKSVSNENFSSGIIDSSVNKNIVFTNSQIEGTITAPYSKNTDWLLKLAIILAVAAIFLWIIAMISLKSREDRHSLITKGYTKKNLMKK